MVQETARLSWSILVRKTQRPRLQGRGYLIDQRDPLVLKPRWNSLQCAGIRVIWIESSVS